MTLVVDDGHGTVDQQVSLPLTSTNTPPEAQEPEFGPFDLLAGHGCRFAEGLGQQP